MHRSRAAKPTRSIRERANHSAWWPMRAEPTSAPLAAANAVVVKPPEQSPLSSLRRAELVDGILPPGVFNGVPGGKEVGAALAGHKDVAVVALVGTVPAGRAVMRAASDTVKPV